MRTVLLPYVDWWGKPEHNLTQAVFTPISNAATRVAALISGEIDMMEPVPIQDIPRIQATPTLKVVQGMEARIIYLGMDQRRDELLFSDVKGQNPFKDRRVRQAFYQSIDVEAIKTRIMRGTSRPTALMVAPMVNGYVSALDRRLPYDPRAAKQLLGEAGYPNGFEVRMNCPNDRYVNDAEICQAVAAMLGRIGVKVDTQAETKAIFFPKALRRNVSFYLAGWTPASLDSHNALFALMATPAQNGQGQYNIGYYSNSRVDELTHRIASEIEPTKRQAMIAEAFMLHAADIGHIPLHQQPLVWGLKNTVQLVQLPDNFNYLRWIVVK